MAILIHYSQLKAIKAQIYIYILYTFIYIFITRGIYISSKYTPATKFYGKFQWSSSGFVFCAVLLLLLLLLLFTWTNQPNTPPHTPSSTFKIYFLAQRKEYNDFLIWKERLWKRSKKQEGEHNNNNKILNIISFI